MEGTKIGWQKKNLIKKKRMKRIEEIIDGDVNVKTSLGQT